VPESVFGVLVVRVVVGGPGDAEVVGGAVVVLG
jgi:hypothetical protein